jgi:hypothetical protein
MAVAPSTCVAWRKPFDPKAQLNFRIRSTPLRQLSAILAAMSHNRESEKSWRMIHG